MAGTTEAMEDEGAVDLANRFNASLVLSGVGDAMGYKLGEWEFNKKGKEIHEELEKLGGIGSLQIKKPDWIVSDDTVMHMATAEGLIGYYGKSKDEKKSLYSSIARKYIECMKDMSGRAPGPTSTNGVAQLNPDKEDGYQIKFDQRGGGCGAAMRAMCLGLFYSREEDLDSLIAVSIESGRMTHNHPTGYLGSLASALFTHYAIQRKPVNEWGAALMKVLPKAKEYVVSQNRDVKENLETWAYFENQWSKYLKERGIDDGFSLPRFPENYDVVARDRFYKSVSFSGWGGASGHDAPMIAYDALLGSGKDWSELCRRGILHGGDNDSTGAIAGAWFGALYGFEGVPESHFKDLEYRERLEKIAGDLFKLHNVMQCEKH